MSLHVIYNHFSIIFLLVTFNLTLIILSNKKILLIINKAV